MTRETVATETPARSAIWRMVTRLRGVVAMAGNVTVVPERTQASSGTILHYRRLTLHRPTR
jgi:hypothetical protein